jgi:hypothetical protein
LRGTFITKMDGVTGRAANCVSRCSLTFTLHITYYWDDEIKDDKLGEAGSARGEIKHTGMEIPMRRNHSEDQGVRGRIILKRILK